MGLVDYDSDSGSSDGEHTAKTVKAPTPASTPAPGKKQPFQRLVDRAHPGKIVVSLPSAGAGATDGHEEDDARPAKRARVGGGGRFSGFSSFLPPPKKTATANATETKETKETAAEQTTTPSESTAARSSSSVHLKTSAEAAFRRRDASATTLQLPPPKALSIPESQKAAADVQLVGNPLMFLPLSVSRKPVKKKAKKGAAATAATAAGAAASTTKAAETTAADTTQEPPKKKVSLFSLEAEPEPAPVDDRTDTGSYQPLFADEHTNEHVDEHEEPVFEHDQQQQQQQQQPQSLDDLADTLNLSARQRRELFGRGGAAHAHTATFNMDQEYRHNEQLRIAGENDQRQQAHNPVRAIQPGKHSLRQLVTAVQTQRDALEESFAKNKAAQRESGSRYGWR